jgi:hypothetical protein
MEGQQPYFWHDSEVGSGMGLDTAENLLKQKGFGTQTQNQMWEDGTVDDQLIEAHFEVLVKMAMHNPQIASKVMQYEGKPYGQIDYPMVVEALDETQVKWALGMESQEGLDVRLHSKTTTIADIEAATRKRVVHTPQYGHNMYQIDNEERFPNSEGEWPEYRFASDQDGCEDQSDAKDDSERPNGAAAEVIASVDQHREAAEDYEESAEPEKNKTPIHSNSVSDTDPWYNPEFPEDNDAWMDSEGPKWPPDEIQSLSELRPWRSGTEGKGLLMKDGRVITWDDVNVHHQQVARLVGGADKVHRYLEYINPDGSTAAFENFDPMDAKALSKHGLKLYDATTEGAWNFG